MKPILLIGVALLIMAAAVAMIVAPRRPLPSHVIQPTPYSTPATAVETPPTSATTYASPPSTETASVTPVPVPQSSPMFGDSQKQEAYEFMQEKRAALSAVPPPQLAGVPHDPRELGAVINNYVNTMAQRAEEFQRAKEALTEQLTPAEAAQLDRQLQGHP